MAIDVPRYPTVVHMLDAAFRRAPEREALVFRDRRLTYAEYVSCVAGFAAELESHGARGSRVVSVLGNSIEACIVPFAAMAAGAQYVPLNPLYTPRELAFLIADAAPCAVIVEAAVQANVAPALPAGVALIAVGAGARSLDTWRGERRTIARFPDPDALGMLQYTGGTSGRPKGVDLVHRAFATNVAQRECLLPTNDGERIICMLPVSHAYGLGMGLFLAPNCAGTLVLLPRYIPEEVLATVERERITVFPGSPTVFNGLLTRADMKTTDWSSVHTCYSGSSALPEETLKRWSEATGAPAFEGYGQTESGPVLTFNPARGVAKARSVGIALPETEIQIVDVATGTKPLAQGEHGEIRARGPQIMRGYRNLPDETAQTLRDGWLYTGDIGWFDADGYLYISDRKKEMLIVGGYNVYPREVEEVLYMHPAVLDAAVVAVKEDYRGELPVAFVALKPGAAADEAALVAHCNANLARYKVPWRIVILPALPKTSVTKTDKQRLRAEAASLNVGAPAPPAPR